VAAGEECAVEGWVSVGVPAAALEEALVGSSEAGPAEEAGPAKVGGPVEALQEALVAALAEEAVGEAVEPAAGVAIAPR
jgi:hypothetical protein